jgi:hypothetical protein
MKRFVSYIPPLLVLILFAPVVARADDGSIATLATPVDTSTPVDPATATPQSLPTTGDPVVASLIFLIGAIGTGALYVLLRRPSR